MFRPTLCVECGPSVAIDEDGCCVTCGNGATGTWFDNLPWRTETGIEIAAARALANIADECRASAEREVAKMRPVYEAAKEYRLASLHHHQLAAYGATGEESRLATERRIAAAQALTEAVDSALEGIGISVSAYKPGEDPGHGR